MARESGVVVSSVKDDQNMHYITVVRLDRSGREVKVRFPDKKRCGQAVRVNV